MQKKTIQFADRIELNAQDKTCISVRDGVLEYMGSELGMEPGDKIFTVYRSPASIGNAFHRMNGIPVTDEHVSINEPAPDTGCTVTDSRMIDIKDGGTMATVGVKNKLAMSDSMMGILERKKQLSLGYSADIVPHTEYDYEQIDINPHHLAVVENGRCGPLCCFLDRKPELKTQEIEVDSMKKKLKFFYDEDGSVSLEQVVEIATSLPEAIKKVPVDRLAELMPPLMEITAYAKEQGVMPDEPAADEDPEEKEIEDEDAEEKEEEEEKKEFGDSKKFKDAVASAAAKQARKLADTEVKRYAQVMGKAKDFLSDYAFGDKSANQIMRDALATQYGDQEFNDAELPTAFKLLKNPAPDYSNFGDSAMPGGLEKRIKTFIEGE